MKKSLLERKEQILKIKFFLIISLFLFTVTEGGFAFAKDSNQSRDLAVDKELAGVSPGILSPGQHENAAQNPQVPGSSDLSHTDAGVKSPSYSTVAHVLSANTIPSTGTVPATEVTNTNAGAQEITTTPTSIEGETTVETNTGTEETATSIEAEVDAGTTTDTETTTEEIVADTESETTVDTTVETEDTTVSADVTVDTDETTVTTDTTTPTSIEGETTAADISAEEIITSIDAELGIDAATTDTTTTDTGALDTTATTNITVTDTGALDTTTTTDTITTDTATLDTTTTAEIDASGATVGSETDIGVEAEIDGSVSGDDIGDDPADGLPTTSDSSTSLI